MSSAVAAGVPVPVPVPAPVAPKPKSNLGPEITDILLRSRSTILEMLEDRGYDTTIYKNISPEQTVILAEGNSRALDIFVPKREGSTAPCDRAVVVFTLIDRIRGKLETFTRDLYAFVPDAMGVNAISKSDDLIIVFNEQESDAFWKASIHAWQADRARITFFHIKHLVVNISRHTLVPPHKKLTAEEAEAQMKKLHITSKTQLPLIKHSDPQARYMGLVPGDMISILRPSPTAGESRFLRVCAA